MYQQRKGVGDSSDKYFTKLPNDVSVREVEHMLPYSETVDQVIIPMVSAIVFVLHSSLVYVSVFIAHGAVCMYLLLYELVYPVKERVTQRLSYSSVSLHKDS